MSKLERCRRSAGRRLFSPAFSLATSLASLEGSETPPPPVVDMGGGGGSRNRTMRTAVSGATIEQAGTVPPQRRKAVVFPGFFVGGLLPSRLRRATSPPGRLHTALRGMGGPAYTVGCLFAMMMGISTLSFTRLDVMPKNRSLIPLCPWEPKTAISALFFLIRSARAFTRLPYPMA